MIKEAIGDNDHFELSDVETKRPGRSYTVDTVRAFKEIYGEENHLYLIVGTDMINDISTWKDVDVLSRMCSFIVIDRFPSPCRRPPEQTSRAASPYSPGKEEGDRKAQGHDTADWRLFLRNP